jgi:hypothetical protein
MIYLGLKRFLNNYHNSPTLNFTPVNLFFFSINLRQTSL